VPLRIVYAGTPEFAVPALEAVASSGHALLAVCTQPDRPAGRGRAPRPSPVKSRAQELGVPVLQPATLNDSTAAATFAAFRPDVLVVVAYGLLLPPAILAVPRLCCINLHASLLPRWRGAAPVQRAILAGDGTTGVTIMRLEPGLDTGPVYAAERVAIGAADTAASLGARLASCGAPLLLGVLAAVEAGTAAAVPQPADGVSYARKIEKQEALIDWSLSAAALDRQVRALVPWPIAETRWRGAQLRIHVAEPLEAAAGAAPGTIVAAGAAGLDVATGSGRLRLESVQLAGRRVVTAREFASGEARHGPLTGARVGVGG
jgi:methionyl-tRNA formyltransferase